jgi:excisionase family DNA binding protein
MKPARDPERGALPDRLLDVREAAALLAVKPTTLYQWAYQRRIPVVKLMGRALRFRESDIRALIANSLRPALRSSIDRELDP